MPLSPSMSGRRGSSARMSSATTESMSAVPARVNNTLLQVLVQPTRHRRRVQPRFEAFSLDDLDCSKYSLGSYWPQHSGGDTTGSDRDGTRQTGSSQLRDPAWAAAQLRTAQQPLRLASGVPLSPSAADGALYCTESCDMDRDRESHHQERAAQLPPARPGAVRRGSSSGNSASPVRRVEEELFPALSVLNVAEEGFNDSEDSATGLYHPEPYSDGLCCPERPSPSQRTLRQPLEHAPSLLQEAENIEGRPYRYNAPVERDRRFGSVGRAAVQPHHSSASKTRTLSGDGSPRLPMGHDDGGDAAATDHQDAYEPGVVEYTVNSRRPQRFQDALPAAAQCYRRLHIVSTDGGVGCTVGNGAECEVSEGEDLDNGVDACEDGGAKWENAFDESNGDDNAAAAPAAARNRCVDKGEERMDTEDGVRRDHDGADGEPSHRQMPPRASKEGRIHPPQPASLPAEAPTCLPLHPRQPPTGHIQWQATDMATSQQPRPIEGDTNQPSKRSRKKDPSKRHNPRAFRNRTTYTWVSTNTTTSVILPRATVQLVPMATFPMDEEVHSAEGHWAVAAPLSPPSSYALSSRSVSGYHQRRSQMEVLDDSAEPTTTGRNRVGYSLPYLPSHSRAEEAAVLRSMPAL